MHNNKPDCEQWCTGVTLLMSISTKVAEVLPKKHSHAETAHQM